MSSRPLAYSYALDSYDNDNPDGTQNAPDTISLSLCPGYGNGPECFTSSDVTETFTCTDHGFTGGGLFASTVASGSTTRPSCYEITLRPGSLGGASARTRASLLQAGKNYFHK